MTWSAHITDTPIEDWGHDILGRRAVVETIADYILNRGASVVALQGGLGDGKSSVLNLLKSTLSGRAIIVDFRAWLPGSEATFATELFKDIVVECRKFVRVPQLQKRALKFARLVSETLPHLAGLKGILPTQSQRDEIDELKKALGRVPRRIAVLIDEIDRMHKDELNVLLKILRGADSIPNITFVCAFSPEEVKRELGKDDVFMEKFFPLPVRLLSPSKEVVQLCFRSQVEKRLTDQGWFREPKEKDRFRELIDDAWVNSLQNVCGNLRQAGRVVNDVDIAGKTIVGEVNPFDLVLIEVVRLFYPEVYEMLRSGGQQLTAPGQGGVLGVLDGDRKAFLDDLNKLVSGRHRPEALRSLLAWLFPSFSRAGDTSVPRNFQRSGQSDERQICDPEYFSIYFQATLPEGRFGSNELREGISELNTSTSEEGARTVLGALMDPVPKGHPKRMNLLRKLSVRGVSDLTPVASEYLAYAVASRSSDLDNASFGPGEIGLANNIILAVASKLADSPDVQRTLEGAMVRSSHDELAGKLLFYLENRDRNQILRNFDNVDVSRIRNVFLERMRNQYIPGNDVDLSSASFNAFRVWVQNSEADRQQANSFLLNFVGQSRRRLAEVIKVIYPSGRFETDPRKLIGGLFPLEILESLLRDLPADEQLNEAENLEVGRMQDLLRGVYPGGPAPSLS